ncbi:Bile salt-activated lipase [Ceratocystis platani]|uniref:Bile salt-activated lipase n=1 Tax=Ceratocystis fimbriata f. sp. platani TaxID=88771 RepID=A0A0F8AY59_CERFI|nr:Bile salt-activated lipase [Ceratocystis platani]
MRFTNGIQDGEFGPHCPQGVVSGFNIIGPGNRYPAGKAINQIFGGVTLPNFREADEDCLYLDLYVPGKALMDGETLPVVVWVFGGAFVVGSKDIYQPFLPWYDGSGLINQSGNNVIFIAFNYRLGSFG